MSTDVLFLIGYVLFVFPVAVLVGRFLGMNDRDDEERGRGSR